MNPELNKVLEDNIALIEKQMYLELFTKCPFKLRAELLQVLKDIELDIVEYDGQVRYYAFRDKYNNVFCAGRPDKKSTKYKYIRTVQNKVVPSLIIIETDLLKALEFGIATSTDPVQLQQSYLNKYTLVPITMADDQQFLMSKEGVDYYDPALQKERKFADAARSELDAQLLGYTKSVVNTDKLRQALTPLARATDDYVWVSNWSGKIKIQMNYDDSVKSQILDTIRKNVNSQVDVQFDTEGPGDGILVTLVGKKVDEIRQRVEDTFGVSL